MNMTSNRSPSCDPQAGDDVVTLRLEVGDAPLDGVVLAMSHAFVTALQGNRLRKVLTWDPRSAVLSFAVEGKYDAPVRRYRVMTEITEWPAGVASNVEAP